MIQSPGPRETRRLLPEPSSSAAERPLIVDVHDVRKVYLHQNRPLEVLKGVSLHVRAGEMLSIVGPSGAGKSTLLHLMGALDRPTSGAVAIAGHAVTSMNGTEIAALRNRTIGFVFQFHHLLPELTAIENVMMPGLIHGGTRRDALEERARQLLREVGLEHRGSHRPSELSGGEQQRVALARALALGPALLLADEPTGNLDTANSQAMHDLFFDLNARHGTTMVIVTHNEALAARIPRVVKMRDGLIVEDAAQPSEPLPGGTELVAP